MKEVIEDLEWPGGAVTLTMHQMPRKLIISSRGTGQLEVWTHWYALHAEGHGMLQCASICTSTATIPMRRYLLAHALYCLAHMRTRRPHRWSFQFRSCLASTANQRSSASAIRQALPGLPALHAGCVGWYTRSKHA